MAQARGPHLLAIVGPSGAGKILVHRGGPVPDAPEAGWADRHAALPETQQFLAPWQTLIHELTGDAEALDSSSSTPTIGRPGARRPLPLAATPRTKRCWSFDQFEELFTLNPARGAGTVRELLGRLALEADVHVLLSMRDDFLIHCQPFTRRLRPVFSELTPLDPPTGAALAAPWSSRR